MVENVRIQGIQGKQVLYELRFKSYWSKRGGGLFLGPQGGCVLSFTAIGRCVHDLWHFAQIEAPFEKVAMEVLPWPTGKV